MTRQRNDATDAEAIAEAAAPPTMRFVAVKSQEQQARAMLVRTRDLLVRQRTQRINARRGHLAEHGVVAQAGAAYLDRLAAAISDDNAALAEPVRDLGNLCLEQIEALSARVAGLDRQMRTTTVEADSTRRLQTMPGVGPITAMAIETFAPPMTVFRRSRDFAAWLGLVPRQHSRGGKQRLGATSKMGQRGIRRLLITEAMAVVQHASRKGAPDGSWLGRKLAKTPRMLVAIALANKMARGLWAMITTSNDFKDPATAAA